MAENAKIAALRRSTPALSHASGPQALSFPWMNTPSDAFSFQRPERTVKLNNPQRLSMPPATFVPARGGGPDRLPPVYKEPQVYYVKPDLDPLPPLSDVIIESPFELVQPGPIVVDPPMYNFDDFLPTPQPSPKYDVSVEEIDDTQPPTSPKYDVSVEEIDGMLDTPIFDAPQTTPVTGMDDTQYLTQLFYDLWLRELEPQYDVSVEVLGQ